MKKKALAVLLTGVMAVGLSACGGGASSSTAPTTSSKAPATSSTAPATSSTAPATSSTAPASGTTLRLVNGKIEVDAQLKELAKAYNENPTKENYDKVKDSVYRSMFLETLNDEYGKGKIDFDKASPEKLEESEKKLRKALKSGFKNNLEIMEKVANESTFGVMMDKKIKENLKENKYVSHEKMKELRDEAIKEGFTANAENQKEYFKNQKKNNYSDEKINNLRAEEMQLDITAKMFGSPNTAKKVLGKKLFEKDFARNSIDGMKIENINNIFKPKPKKMSL